jgi:2'-5' RNA ligase
MSAGDRLRLFVAVSVPEDRLRAAGEVAESIKPSFPGARWTDLANQHVTLKFLGWTTADALAGIEAAMRAVASAHAPAELSIGELGAFPSTRRVRVVWLGLDDPGGRLARVAGGLDASLAPLGFPAEERAFTPHLTLARFKVPFKMRDEWPDATVEAEPWTVEAIELWRSHLSPKGARYEVVERFDLGSS